MNGMGPHKYCFGGYAPLDLVHLSSIEMLTFMLGGGTIFFLSWFMFQSNGP